MMLNDCEMQALRYLQHLSNIMKYGHVIRPRGEEVREIEDLKLEVNPHYPFMTFKDRNYNIDYFRKEMLWKLGANKYDDSIKAHAKMWESVQNPNGTFNSNYGQYWFGSQMGIWHVVMELLRDVDSRRAVIPMLSAEHLTPETKDTVCTECVGFRIRRNASGTQFLNMSVHMRSSDAVFGLGTDIPTFSFLYRLVYALIINHYPKLHVGTITIIAMSAHIYSRHYHMVEKIIDGAIKSYVPKGMPFSNTDEAMQLIADRGMLRPNKGWALTDWLLGLEA